MFSPNIPFLKCFSKHTLSSMFSPYKPFLQCFSKHPNILSLACVLQTYPGEAPPPPGSDAYATYSLSLSHVFYLHTLSLMFSLNIPSLPWFFSKHTLSLQCFLQPFPLSYVFSIHFPSPMLSTCTYLPNLRSVSTSLSLLSCSTSRGLLTINIF